MGVKGSNIGVMSPLFQVDVTLASPRFWSKFKFASFILPQDRFLVHLFIELSISYLVPIRRSFFSYELDFLPNFFLLGHFLKQIFASLRITAFACCKW